MNHLNLNSRIVARWLKAKGWKRSHDDLGRPVFIDPISTCECYMGLAVETQMSREIKELAQ